MKRTLFASAISLALTACAHNEPGIVVRTVEVPTPVPCLAADQVPAEPETVASRLTGDPAHDLPIIAASALRLRAWGRTMHGALVACAG